MNSSSFRRFYPFIFVSRLLLSLIEVSLSSNATQALHLVLQPTKPNNSYFSLTGSTFLLNCTITGKSVHVFNISWWHNGENLSSSKTQQIDNVTLQLQLSNTRKSDNGIYWCGSKSDKKSLRIIISLSVADPPSPPRNLEWNAIGALDREVHVYWAASSYTGGLPIDYSIKLCLNDSVINPTPPLAPMCKWIDKCHHVQPEHVNVFDDKRHFSCILKGDEYDFPGCGTPCSYSIYVVASNAVGSASTEIFLPILRFSQATPWPPDRFTVEQLSDRVKELRVSWKAKRGWNYMQDIDKEYTILYGTREDKENKTAVVINKEFTILRGLKAYTDYYVYLKVRFHNRDESEENSAYSDILGPTVIKTSPGDPVNPPVVKSYHSDIFPSNSGLRNVTVEWKLADVSSWRGTPGKYKVFCRRHKGQSPTLEYSTDATLNKTTLPKLNSRTKYNVFLKMCNKANKCSDIGEPYIINEVQEKDKPTISDKKMSTAQIATVSVLTGMGLLVGVICTVYLLRKCRRGELTRHILNILPLRERITLDPPTHYEYLEEASIRTEEAYEELR